MSATVDSGDRPNNSEDSLTKSAGRQLFVMALGAMAIVALLMTGLSWATSATGSSGGLQEGVNSDTNTITGVLAQEPPQLDTSRATDQVSGMINGHVTEGLLRYDENNQLAPGVAKRWEITETGATFWLRENAQWSDGTNVTAHDFVFAWQTALSPKVASEYAFILYPVKNAEAINLGNMALDQLGAIAIDDQTLKVEFEKPIAYFDKLVAFTTYAPIKKEFYLSRDGRYGADADDLLYNGPFMITTWVHGAHLKLERNPNYWDQERIHLDVIDFPYITSDTNTALNLFKDEKIANVSLNAETLTNALEQGWHLNRFMDGSIFFIEFNHRDGRLTRNFHLRRAIQLAQDPAELVYKVIKIPGYLPGQTLFPAWLKGVNGSFRQEYPPRQHKMDLKAARQHLEIARMELGLDEFPPLMMLTGDNPISNKQSEYYQSLFKKNLGLDMKIDKQIFKQRLAKMLSGEFDLVLAGWGPDFDDPMTFGDLFASWNLNNRGQYNNPELDAQVAIAQDSLDPKTRMDAFGKIQNILYDDAVILPNYERGIVYVADDRLKGLVRRAVGTDPDYTGAYIAKD